MNIRKIIREEMDDMDWIKEVPSSLSKDHQPKEGSTMICIPGFTNEWNGYKYDKASHDPSYGGHGYEEGKVIKVGSTNYEGYRTVVWPEDGGSGIYVDVLIYY